MLANQIRLLQNFALLQIFALLLQIFALLSLLFGINCTEIDQSHSSIISIYIIIRFTWYFYKTCLEPQLPNTIDTNSEIQINVPVII